MREVALISRRAIAAALPIAVLAGAAATAAAALPVPAGDFGMAARIDAAAARCRTAKQTLAESLDAYERALPPPHFTLDLRHRKPGSHFTRAIERRLVDGKTPMRSTNRAGNPDHRHVATVETVEQDLDRCEPGDRARRRLLYRMRRRARARATQVENLEASFRLEKLEREVDRAERAFDELARGLFAAPASTMAEVLVQARALSAYAETIEASHAAWQAGRFGKQLAIGLQNVARAA